MSEASAIQVKKTGLLRTPSFDWLFLVGLPLFAIACAFFVFRYPQYQELVITLNLWLFGYHHVISTYSRIGFDWVSIKTHWFFIGVLPFLVLLGVVLAFKWGGFVLMSSIYLYWQWYHYTRQSEGVSKSYGMKSNNKAILNAPFHRTLFYLVPILSMVLMISRPDQMFFGSSFYDLTLSESFRTVIFASLILTLVVGVSWVLTCLKSGALTPFYVCYFLGHYAIYVVSYVLITDITSGWLAINIWHNIQYIVVVYVFNANRFKNGVDSNHLLISFLSQKNRLFLYLIFFITAAFVFYGAVDHLIEGLSESSSLPMLLIVYSAINFHHYIVDSQIWKLRKESIQKNLS